MKSAIIIAIVVVVLGLRLFMRRRRASSPRLRERSLSDVALVAKREIRERVKTRAFRVATLIVLLVVAAGIVIPVVRKGHETTVHVGVVGTTSTTLRTTAQQAAMLDSAKAAISSEPNLSRALKDLKDGTVDLVVDRSARLYVKQAFSASDNGPIAFVAESLARTLGLEAALVRDGVSANAAAQLAKPIALPVTALAPAKHRSTTVITAIYVLILMYVLLSQYGTWILMGILEEKSNRIVEVLLAAVSPLRLLAGKVGGIGVVALAQAAVIVGFALALAAATGSDLIKGTAASSVVLGLVWLLLGYAFYCWLYAAAGSMIERQDQLQAIALPLQLPILFGYIVALTSLGSSTPSVFVKVLAYLPPTAPFEMTVLTANGAATWWEVTTSALISLAATVALARFAALIFRRAILRPSRQFKFSDARSLLRLVSRG
ncbi:MAG: ABC transporter permease [Acidimicrobiales bacterium]